MITRTSTGEAYAFWIFAVIAVIASIQMVRSRKAVHSALWLVLVMFCLSVFYTLQQAPFLGVVQIAVYAGAIMMLFLFVIMLVGVESRESLTETIKGQRLGASIAALASGALLVSAIVDATHKPQAVGLNAVNKAHGGNIEGLARLIFTDYVFTFEVISALLIVAALGAMVLGHRERLVPRPTQRDLMRERVRSGHPGTLTGPGVYALATDASRPALLPDGRPDLDSVLPELASIAAVPHSDASHVREDA
jgi:NADH-quinone oxidoreductase subunit J